jgi:histidyl-tRNA synthetase
VQPAQQFEPRQFSHLSASLERHMALYGYHTVETPVIQSADLFLTRAGDQIIEHLFTFERRGKQYALRPEFTASAAALYAAKCSEGTVARWQFHGAIFEDNPAGNGVTYQHYASGAELLGLVGSLAEAEIIAMAAHGLTRHNIQNWQLVIGNVQLVRHLLAGFHIDSRAQRFLLSHVAALKNPDQGKAYVIELLDKLIVGNLKNHETVAGGAAEELNTQQLLDVLLDATQHGGTMGGRTRHDIVRRLLQKRQRAAERDQFLKALDFLEAWSKIDAAPTEAFATMRAWIASDDSLAQTIFEDWKRLLDLLDAFDIPTDRIRIQPALARNWDYYTGMVFELAAADTCPLGGGGRYDELAQLLGADYDVPAVGFTYYADELLKRAALEGHNHTQMISLVVSPDAETDGARWSHLLRQHGYMVKVSSTDAIFAATPSEVVLQVQADGLVEWAGKTYPMAAVETLIADMESK